MKSHHWAFGLSCFFLLGIFTFTGFAQDSKPATETVSAVSPDGRLAANYDSGKEDGVISHLRIQIAKTGEMIWRDPDEDPSVLLRGASFLWSPNGKRVAFMFSLGRSEEFQILNVQDGKITAMELELPEPPIEKDAGPDHASKFASAKLVKWKTDDLAEVEFKGRVQLWPREEWIDYEYSATLTLPEGKCVFLPEKKIERLK